MGRELALESRSPRALRPGLDLTGAAPLSFAPAGTRVPPEHRCARHRLPRTRVCGSATPFPLPGCAGPDPRLHSVHGRTPPLHPRVWHMEQSLCGSPVAPCEGWPHEDRGGVGCAPSPSPTLTPSGLETELRLALKWPFVYCPWRTDEPGGRGWHCRGCLGRAVLNSAGFGEQGECPASCGQAYCPRHPQTRRYLSLRIRHLLRVPLSFNSCLWSALSRPGFVLGGEE